VQTAFCRSAKSVTEKKQQQGGCAEADKRTVQALHFDRFIELVRKGVDFWRLGILPVELPLMNFQVKPDRLINVFFRSN
jgi:hypothetical protein